MHYGGLSLGLILGNAPLLLNKRVVYMDKLTERIKSIKNRCEIIEVLYEQKRVELIPTTLEDMYDVVHMLIDDYCIEKE